ncbi:hypothetical protein ACFQ88_39285 [Paenibacillus sp. NPDC056579]|uniref:hypothetical protein n=1 Tax=Paenibacillus sp. NPDC056579 TaxID=3345871 RepID=UPI0036C1C63D
MAYYSYSFEMIFSGVSVNGTVSNELCKDLSGTHTMLDTLEFQRHSDEETLIKGKVTTSFTYPPANIDAYGDAFQYVLMNLEMWVHKALMLSLRPARVGSLPRVQKKGQTTFSLLEISNEGFNMPPKYSTMEGFRVLNEISDPIEIKDLETALTNVSKLQGVGETDIEDAVQRALFWMGSANDAGNGTGLHFHEIVSKFRALWTAYNALYYLESGARFTSREGTIIQGEKAEIIMYMNNRPDFAKSFLSSYATRRTVILKSFAGASLKLRKGSGYVNVSDELNYYLDKQMNPIGPRLPAPTLTNDIEEALLMCIYSIRNHNFHGSNLENALSLLRESIDVLEGFLRHSILEELKTVV